MKLRITLILLALILSGMLAAMWQRKESPREWADGLVALWHRMLPSPQGENVPPRPQPEPESTQPPAPLPEEPTAPEMTEIPPPPPVPSEKTAKQTALDSLRVEPSRWPREVTTVREVEVPLQHDGRVSGSVKLAAGTKLPLAGMEDGRLKVRFGGSAFSVENDATDIQRQAARIMKTRAEEEDNPSPESLEPSIVSKMNAEPAARPKTSPGLVSDKTAVVCVLSWFSPIGSLNGVKQWKGDGYAYEADTASNEVRNYTTSPIDSLPEEAPEIGSSEFYRLIRRAAIATQKQMLGAGFDVMTFDMLPMPDYEPSQPMDERNSPFGHFKTYLEWVKAGEETGMKVAFMPDCANRSADYPELRVLTVDEWRAVLSAALDHIPDSAAVWKLNGAPVIVHFGTDVTYSQKMAPDSEGVLPDGGWRQVLDRLRKEGKKFFFVADIRPSDRIQEWNAIADGVHIFSPAAPEGFSTEYQTTAKRDFRVPFIWTVSPGYYRSGAAYVEPNFARIHSVYRAAMKAGAKYIYVLTWNDLDEDTDIAPSLNKGDCLLRVFGFYNAWFKSTKQPEPKDDMVFLSYPLRIPEEVVSHPPNWGNGKWTSPEFRPKVFYWAYVNSARTLEVDGVGKVSLPKGLSFGEVGKIARDISGPVLMKARLDGESKTLPSVRLIGKEEQRRGMGGVEFRYVDLLKGGGNE